MYALIRKLLKGVRQLPQLLPLLLYVYPASCPPIISMLSIRLADATLMTKVGLNVQEGSRPCNLPCL